MRFLCAALGAFWLASPAYASAPEPTEWKQSWSACKAAQDCMVLSDKCGGKTAVNKRFRKKGQAWLDMVYAGVECAEKRTHSALDDGLQCDDYQCRALPKSQQGGIF